MDRDQSFLERLTAETERCLDITCGLGERLRAEQEDETATGKGRTVPDRQWVRAFREYKDGLGRLHMQRMLAAKLNLAGRAIEALTEEQYREEMRQLGEEAIRLMSKDDLLKEISKRGDPVALGEDGNRLMALKPSWDESEVARQVGKFLDADSTEKPEEP